MPEFFDDNINLAEKGLNNMKKIISFICMLALICTLVAPMSLVEVSAAAKDDWYKQSTSAWSVSGGAKRMPDGSVYLPDGAPMLQARALYADKFTVSFSYKIETISNSLGVQVHFEGHNRAGYYINQVQFQYLAGVRQFLFLTRADGMITA